MASYSNQISTNPRVASVLLSAHQKKSYSLGGLNVTQQEYSRVIQGAAVGEDYIVVGRVRSHQTSTTLQSSTQRFTANRENQGVDLLLIDRHQPSNRAFYQF